MSEYRSITDIDGIYAANATNVDGATGCTVIVCPAGATVGVDVRGGAPATRETDLLRPEETVQEVHAVVLSGGSAYGLAASTGVIEELERRDIGLDVGVGKVPIVTGACLFDLACGRPDVRPTAADGAAAVTAALDGEKLPLGVGNVGAGTGCTVGKLGGPARSMKTGLGESVQTCGPLVCGAVAAVNAVGDVVDPVSGEGIAGLLDETSNDGDSIFVMATGEVEMPIDVVGVLATKALEGAIVDAALSAKGAYGLKAACDL